MAHGLLQDRFLVSAAIPISNKSTNPSTHVQCLPLKNVLHLLNHSRCDRYKYNAEKTIKTWIDLRSAISFICSVVQVNVLWLPSGICRSRNEWSTAQVANCCFASSIHWRYSGDCSQLQFSICKNKQIGLQTKWTFYFWFAERVCAVAAFSGTGTTPSWLPARYNAIVPQWRKELRIWDYNATAHSCCSKFWHLRRILQDR